MPILAAALALNGTWEPVPRALRPRLARFASRPGEVRFADPDGAARLLAAGEVSEIVLLWRAVLRAGPGLPGLAAPFDFPSGELRRRFRIVSMKPVPSGIFLRLTD
ncbi:MAG TPA: hypothetical protein VIM58_01440 [Candidatus Methylacidiphilales bacterium]